MSAWIGQARRHWVIAPETVDKSRDDRLKEPTREPMVHKRRDLGEIPVVRQLGKLGSYRG